MQENGKYKNLKKINFWERFFFFKQMPEYGSSFDPKKVSFDISVIYIVVGFIWILFSDRIVNKLVSNKDIITLISMIKGWFFIIASGTLIYSLIYYTMRRIRKAEKSVIESYDELSSTHEKLEASYKEISISKEEIKNQFEELQKNQLIINHLAYYDVLTDLPNRVLFIDKIKKSMELALDKNEKIAIIFFDIDNFKKINDLLGHYIGDKLLIDISNKLKLSLNSNETLARFSGDEFTIFIENIKNKNDIISAIDRIKNMFSRPFEAENSKILISSSFGISVFPDHGIKVDELLKKADTAMYKAKEIGRNNYQFYDDKMRDEVLRKLMIEELLVNALKKEELYLCYQPQISTRTSEIRGVEALLRWENTVIGMVSPLEFIPFAEETGLIIPIGEWVLEHACKMNKKWQDIYNYDLIISVNISPVQLKQQNFVEKVKSILDKTGLEPRLLELEITENILIDSQDTVKLLNELKKLGVKISLDDFGTGYSSLNYLTKLPLNTLKIDKTFIDSLKNGSKENAVTEAIITLIHKLELEVIAEGVETNDQLEYLKHSKCDTVQGYLFCKPLIERDLVSVIANGSITLN